MTYSRESSPDNAEKYSTIRNVRLNSMKGKRTKWYFVDNKENQTKPEICGRNLRRTRMDGAVPPNAGGDIRKGVGKTAVTSRLLDMSTTGRPDSRRSYA